MLVIYSKLAIAPHDREWIEAIRQAHDPQFRLVEPHVTFVFPFDGIPIEAVFAHVREAARQASAIRFHLARAAVASDTIGAINHVFLLPAQGDEEMRILHDRLYAGPLAPKLHPAISYLPHVTVGAFTRHREAEDVAASLGKFDIPGTLNAIHIADHDAGYLNELHQIPLG